VVTVWPKVVNAKVDIIPAKVRTLKDLKRFLAKTTAASRAALFLPVQIPSVKPVIPLVGERERFQGNKL
jgi:hypothetical protein